MKHKKRHKQQPLRIGIFSLAEIRLAQDAMKAFECWLHQAGHEVPKKAFAEETVILVKSKLERMQASLGHLELFEYNEHIVLLAAIQQYMADLPADSATSRQMEQLRQCEHIKAFALLALQATHTRPPHD